jgi:hypothetical protein
MFCYFLIISPIFPMKKLVVHLPRRITAPQALDLRRLSDAASEASGGRRRTNSEASEVSEVSEDWEIY